MDNLKYYSVPCKTSSHCSWKIHLFRWDLLIMPLPWKAYSTSIKLHHNNNKQHQIIRRLPWADKTFYLFQVKHIKVLNVQSLPISCLLEPKRDIPFPDRHNYSGEREFHKEEATTKKAPLFLCVGINSGLAVAPPAVSGYSLLSQHLLENHWKCLGIRSEAVCNPSMYSHNTEGWVQDKYKNKCCLKCPDPSMVRTLNIKASNKNIPGFPASQIYKQFVSSFRSLFGSPSSGP